MARFAKAAGAWRDVEHPRSQGLKAAYEKAIGHPTSDSTVYNPLHRYGWRKLMPRPFHPKRNLAAQSAAADQVAVFLPQSGILLSSEMVPAQHFPVLRTLRGEAFRSPVDWYQSIDALRRFRANAMVPSHGVPVIGARRRGDAQLS